MDTDNVVDATDLVIARKNLVGAALTGGETFASARCNNNCGVADIFQLERYVSGADPDLENACSGYGAP